MANLEPSEIFWTSFEPKQTHRFHMYIDGIPAFTIRATSRPGQQSDTIELNHINVQRKVKGRTTWKDLAITLRDPIVPSAAQAVMEWLRLHHETVTGRDGYADFYKKDLTIMVLGPATDVVETWKIKGAWIDDYDPGSLDWDGSGQLEIGLNLKFDYAILDF